MSFLVEHNGKRPRIHDSAFVSPAATLCGDVSIGKETCILAGAVLTAESGPVEIGSRCIIMEHAVIRGVSRHPVKIGDHVLVGPHAHLSGCTIEDEVFLATGSSVFNGAYLEKGSTVRINGIVHIRTRLPAGVKMPIGWIAIGDPVELLPPERHERIGELMLDRGFSRTAFGPDAVSTKAITERYARSLRKHGSDIL